MDTGHFSAGCFVADDQPLFLTAMTGGPRNKLVSCCCAGYVVDAMNMIVWCVIFSAITRCVYQHGFIDRGYLKLVRRSVGQYDFVFKLLREIGIVGERLYLIVHYLVVLGSGNPYPVGMTGVVAGEDIPGFIASSRCRIKTDDKWVTEFVNSFDLVISFH